MDGQEAIVIPAFTREDFLDGTGPFEWLHQFKDDRFTLNRMTQKLADDARKLKVYGVKGMYQDYARSLRAAASGAVSDNVTRFEGQELELSCGEWEADERGVSIWTPLGERFACPHPILPVLRLVNIDTGVEKVKLAYRKGPVWRHVIVDKRTIASANSIVALADSGVAVTSENARYLVQYLSDLENINYDVIPEMASVGRMGWVGGGFSPYVDGVVFDGEDCFRKLFESVRTQGSEETWMGFMREIRATMSVPARVMLASSFASVLIKPLHALSFFTHLWGGTEAAKTVGMALAVSIWANPEKGQYWSTFNGTGVGQELSAGFLNSLPLALDEFQLVKDKKNFESYVYMLAEGVGKVRGAKQGGLQRTQTWSNCVLTTGEMPITNFLTGAGAFNRILEIECTEKLFADFRQVLNTIRDNYGWAGKRFIEYLQEDGNAEEAENTYQAFYNEIVRSETTEKQAMAGALILTADHLATEWLFKDNRALKFADIQKYLQTKTEVDMGKRAYGYLCEVVAVNANRFREKDNPGEIWGVSDTDNGRVYINRAIFSRLCEDGGFSDRATLSWLLRNGLIGTSMDKRCGKPQPTVQKKICGNNTKCVLLYLQADEEDLELIDELDG